MDLLSLIPSKDQIKSGLILDSRNFEDIFARLDLHMNAPSNRHLLEEYKQLRNARDIISSIDRLKEPEELKTQLLWLQEKCTSFVPKIKAAAPKASGFSSEEEDWTWLFEDDAILTPMTLLKFVPFIKAEFEQDPNTMQRILKMEEILQFFDEHPAVDAQSEQEEKEILNSIRNEMRLHMAERTIKIGPSKPREVQQQDQRQDHLKGFWMEAQKEMTIWHEGNKQNNDKISHKEFVEVWNKIGGKLWNIIKED